jgi:bifunctional non-homologous end joining protein LigD
MFYDLLRRRGDPVFYPFDCLHDGRDPRELSLMRRKVILKRIIGKHPRILLARHFDHRVAALFRVVRENDLEGIVAKRKSAAYSIDWFKIRNPS